MIDRTHLDALELRLSNERMRLAAAKRPRERELRAVWVAGIEREIAAEKRFLGIDDSPLPAMTLQQIFDELNG